MKMKRVESLFYGYVHNTPTSVCVSCRELIHDGIIESIRDMGLANMNLEVIVDTPISMELYEEIEDYFIDDMSPLICDKCAYVVLEAMRKTIQENGVVI